MEETKKGFHIDCGSEEDMSLTSMGITFTLLGTTFSSMDGYPRLISIAFLLLGVILPAYEFIKKQASQEISCSHNTDGQGGDL